MPIYSGSVDIPKAYSVEGHSLWDAFTISGIDCFGASHTKAGMMGYFQSEALSVANTISKLSSDWAHFIFITDPHGAGNMNHSQAIGLYLLDNTPASMLVLGGDYSKSSWNETEYNTYVAPFLNGRLTNKIYACVGNHETYGGAYEAAQYCIYRDFAMNKTDIVGNKSAVYFYKDDTVRKIRYMFINTSDTGSAYEMSTTQINWIKTNVRLPASDWHLVVIGHVTISDMGGFLYEGNPPTYAGERNGDAIRRAIKNCNGHIVGYICGHQHIDRTGRWNGFQETTLTVDKFENINYYPGTSNITRKTGTNSEQAVSVISINPKTKKVDIRRVGCGRQRTISYSYS